MTGPCPGQIAAEPVLGGERVQPVQRAEVGAELAVGVRHDGGAATEDGVPGQHGAVRGHAGRTASRPCAPASPRRGSPGRPPPPRRRRRGPRCRAGTPGRARRTPQPIRSANSRAASEWSAWWWVSSTAATSPARSATVSRCSRSDGPGSTTTERRAPGSRSTQVLVPSRVIRFGVRRQHALRPRPERAAGPRTLGPGAIRVSPAGRPAAAAGRRASTACAPRPAARRPG